MPYLVRGLEPFGHLNRNRERLSQLQRTFVNALAQRAALEEGHDDEGASFYLVDFVDRADVGVVKLGRGFRFALEALAAFFVAQQMRREKLQRHRSIELGVLGFVNHTHPAFTEFLGDLVMRNGLPDQGYAPQNLAIVPAAAELDQQLRAAGVSLR